MLFVRELSFLYLVAGSTEDQVESTLKTITESQYSILQQGAQAVCAGEISADTYSARIFRQDAKFLSKLIVSRVTSTLLRHHAQTLTRLAKILVKEYESSYSSRSYSKKRIRSVGNRKGKSVGNTHGATSSTYTHDTSSASFTQLSPSSSSSSSSSSSEEEEDKRQEETQGGGSWGEERKEASQEETWQLNG